MRRGEVWTLRDPRNQSRRVRVVVMSSDDYNGQPKALPHVVPIVRQSPGERPTEYVARLGEMDPVTGVAVVSRPERVHPSHGTELIGMLTGATMEVICAAIRDLYELN